MLPSFRQRHTLLIVALVGVLLLVALLAAVLPDAVAHARPIPESTPQPDLQGVADVALSADVAYGGMYRVGSWVPVRVTVQNDGTDMAAEVRVTVRSSATFAASVDLPGGARKAVIVYAFVPGFARQMTVSLVDSGASADTAASPLLQQQLTLDPQTSDKHMVGVVSDDGTSLRFPDMVNNAHVVNVPLDLRDIPDRALGLSTFDTLVLDDVATRELETAQQTALYEWVLRGGHIVVSGGVNAQQTIEGLPAALQPVRVLGVEQVDAGSLLGITDGAPGTIALTFAEPVDNASRVFSSSAMRESEQPLIGDQSLLIKRPVGKGAVLFSAVPLDSVALARWEGEQSFWNSLLQQRQHLPAGFGPTDMTLDTFTESNVATTLTQLPALALPSLLTLGVLLLSYMVLVGPVTYLVLRLLDRQALGWIVVPTLTVIFALVAYGTGYAQRGGDVVLNQITLVEPLEAGQDEEALARVRSFVGIFSPSHRKYTLETSQPVLLRPISLQGPWNPTDTTSHDGRFLQLAPVPAAPGASVTDLEIAQWSMRAVLADEVRFYHGVDARIVLESDTLLGEVANETEHTLRDVVLVQGNRVARLGDLEPGEQRRAELVVPANASGMPDMPFASMPLSYLIYGEQMDRFNRPGGEQFPPALQLRVGLLDALYSYGPVVRTAQPLLFAWTDEALLDIDLRDQRVERQKVTLVTFAPPLHVAGGRVSLGQGWLERQFDAPAESLCMGSQGLGVTLLNQPVVGMLRLPRELAEIRLDEMQLFLAADGNWPEDVTVELFDWSARDWTPHTLAAMQPLGIIQPERFLNGVGEIRLRLSSETPMQHMSGCMYVDAKLVGTMP